MWELDCKESWVPKNWCFWTVVLEKTLESPLDCKEIQPVHPKGNQSWVFIGRTDAEAKAPMLWPPDAESPLIRKAPNAGKDWRQEEKGMAEDEMAGWHHRLNGQEFEQALEVGDWRGSLTCCSPRGHKESERTEWLNGTDPTIPKLLVISFIHWIDFISLLKLNWSHLVDVFLYTVFFSFDLCVSIDANTIHLSFCSFLVCAVCCAESLSCVQLYSLPRLLSPWGFSRQEYWSGLPCPPPGDLLNPRIEPRSPTL